MKMKMRALYVHVGGGLILAVCLFTFIFLMRGQYNSPDERANDFFSRQWAEHGIMTVDAPEQSASLSYPLFPRSTQPVGQVIRPVGFIGLPLVYGTLAKLMGVGSIPYLTVIAFFLGALAWWFLTDKIFGRHVAHVSVWLYLLHPALLYYSVRGLYPNVLLLTMVLCAVAAAWRAYELWRTRLAKKWLWCGAAFISAFIAVLVRPPEAFVLFALVMSSACVFGEKKFRRWCGAGLGILFILGLFGWFLRHVGALSGAYPFLRDSSLLEIIFPFGIHPMLVWQNCTQFIVKLFWPWVLVSTVGVLWWVWHAYTTRHWPRLILAYLWVVVPASVWLFVAYGSWAIQDNPADPHAVTIGISYVRYWLPHFLFRMPFAVILIFAAREKFFPSWSVQKTGVGLVVVLALCGAWRLWSGVDGLGAVILENKNAATIVEQVTKIIPPNTVLAVRAWDKHFFPTVPILQPFPKEFRALLVVHELRGRGIPVYAFIEPVKQVDEWWFATHGLRARAVQNFGVHTLYEITE